MPRKRHVSESDDSDNGDDVPVEKEKEKEYVVESIIRHRRYRRQFQYLIKWEGYSVEESTWEFEDNLTNCPEILENYKKQMEENPPPTTTKRRPKKSRLDSDGSQASPPSIETLETDAGENKKSDGEKPDGEKENDGDEVYESADDHLPDVTSNGSHEDTTTAADDGGTTDGEEPDESSMNSSSSSSGTETGWDRGWVARKVLGVTRNPDNSLWVLISWQNSNFPPELVPNHIANEKCPALMIEYYEKHLFWKTYGGKKRAAAITT